MLQRKQIGSDAVGLGLGVDRLDKADVVREEVPPAVKVRLPRSRDAGAHILSAYSAGAFQPVGSSLIGLKSTTSSSLTAKTLGRPDQLGRNSNLGENARVVGEVVGRAVEDLRHERLVPVGHDVEMDVRGAVRVAIEQLEQLAGRVIEGDGVGRRTEADQAVAALAVRLEAASAVVLGLARILTAHVSELRFECELTLLS